MIRRSVLMVLSVFLMAGPVFQCTVQPQSNTESKKKRIEALAQILVHNPRDEKALQELGIILVKSGSFDKGRQLLQKAAQINPQDPKTVFYLALGLEFSGEEEKAFQIFRHYKDKVKPAPYGRLMEARYNALLKKAIEEQSKILLAQESQLGAQSIVPNTVAVVPFQYYGKNSAYASLGKGLCEMIITDLSQVKDIQLIERVRMQSLMDEMNLQQAGLTKAETAPRCGKLLGASQIMHGAFDINNDRVTLDFEMADLTKQHQAVTLKTTESLKDIFVFEKRLVFSVLAKMGFELSPLEKSRIMHIPTKNLQAFMAYCTGLDKLDAGQFQEAASSFQKAIDLDPKFEMAGQKAEQAVNVAQTGVSQETVLAQIDRLETGETSQMNTGVVDDLVQARLEQLSNSMGSNFIPGTENRKTAEEAAMAGADMGSGKLADPPKVPGGP